jgi:hypothetical protein
MLIRWVYNNTLPVLMRLPLNDILHDQMTWHAGHLYVLAERIGLPQLQDIAVDTLLSFFEANKILPCPEFMVYLYSQTKKTSPIRKLLARSLHFVVYSPGDPSKWPLEKLLKAQNECTDLGVDYTQLFRDHVVARNPWTLPNCEFHCHGKEEACMSSRN